MERGDFVTFADHLNGLQSAAWKCSAEYREKLLGAFNAHHWRKPWIKVYQVRCEDFRHVFGIAANDPIKHLFDYFFIWTLAADLLLPHHFGHTLNARLQMPPIRAERHVEYLRSLLLRGRGLNIRVIHRPIELGIPRRSLQGFRCGLEACLKRRTTLMRIGGAAGPIEHQPRLD